MATPPNSLQIRQSTAVMIQHGVLERPQGLLWGADVPEKGVAGPSPENLDDVVRYACVCQGRCTADAERVGVYVRRRGEGGKQDADCEFTGEEVPVVKYEQRGCGRRMANTGEMPKRRYWTKGRW